MMALLLVISCSARFIHSKFSSWFLLHVLTYTLPVIMILHAPSTWPFAGVALLVVAFDLVIAWCNTTAGTLANARIVSRDVTFLSVPRGELQIKPGSYYRVCVPQLSSYEWHPFSVISSNASPNLEFLVKSAGDWTGSLHELVGSKSGASQNIFIQGPHGSAGSTSTGTGKQTILCVATGIGITPFISHVSSAVDQHTMYHVSSQRDKILGVETPHPDTSLELIWVVRDWATIKYLFEYLCQIDSRQQEWDFKPVSITVHFTGLGNGALSNLILLLAVISRCEQHLSPTFQIKIGRPDFNALLNAHQGDMVYRGSSVFYCGAGPLGDTIKDMCSARNLKFKPEFFPVENFETKKA